MKRITGLCFRGDRVGVELLPFIEVIIQSDSQGIALPLGYYAWVNGDKWLGIQGLVSPLLKAL